MGFKFRVFNLSRIFKSYPVLLNFFFSFVIQKIWLNSARANYFQIFVHLRACYRHINFFSLLFRVGVAFFFENYMAPSLDRPSGFTIIWRIWIIKSSMKNKFVIINFWIILNEDQTLILSLKRIIIPFVIWRRLQTIELPSSINWQTIFIAVVRSLDITNCQGCLSTRVFSDWSPNIYPNPPIAISSSIFLLLHNALLFSCVWMHDSRRSLMVRSDFMVRYMVMHGPWINFFQ